MTRVGTSLVKDPAETLPQDIVLPVDWGTPTSAYSHSSVANVGAAYQVSGEDIVKLLRDRGILTTDNPTDPAKNLFRSETGEITIDAPHDVMTLDTPRTAGGFAPAGATIHTTHGMDVSVRDTAATVWVSSLDDQPIRNSGHLLVTHLTDLQNTGIHYAEHARKTLLEWGKLPYLVRAGQAEVRLQLEQPAVYQVWALGTNGTHLAEVPSQAAGNTLTFTADVAGYGGHGAVLSYEIARR